MEDMVDNTDRTWDIPYSEDKDITDAQKQSIYKKWRINDQGMTWPEFLRSARLMPYDGCVIVRWCGMWVGVEKDGYAHT